MNGVSEKDRNDRAEKVVNRILDNCVWINIHTLNAKSELLIIEAREGKGYGARWGVDQGFRGLVEPPMEGGHEKKWKH